METHEEEDCSTRPSSLSFGERRGTKPLGFLTTCSRYPIFVGSFLLGRWVAYRETTTTTTTTTTIHGPASPVYLAASFSKIREDDGFQGDSSRALLSSVNSTCVLLFAINRHANGQCDCLDTSIKESRIGAPPRAKRSKSRDEVDRRLQESKAEFLRPGPPGQEHPLPDDGVTAPSARRNKESPPGAAGLDDTRPLTLAPETPTMQKRQNPEATGGQATENRTPPNESTFTPPPTSSPSDRTFSFLKIFPNDQKKPNPDTPSAYASRHAPPQLHMNPVSNQ
ncbi:uncharacterized protein CLUP02_10301 [Colletotrichum lupini]|uniref:Uncharacterized protein n=1 Tax=Colletotrichum lupini TaxID=145971 RepID=A0A9Q8SX97_9PEZI|nr:uncharacterized protein CLUP02_10301 [Colletotrichum lupini]UQC84805.1 hypothetical protein CLUP02_10301 [Colletotrichum lupini]